MPEPITLGVLLRVHDRPRTTRIVLEELRHWASLSPSELLIRTAVLADRPTPGVVDTVHRAQAWPDSPVAAWKYQPFPMLDPRGEHFLESQNLHLDILEGVCDPDWVLMADDDRWPEPRKTAEILLPSLRREDVDAYFFDSLFFYDNTDTYTLTRQHYSALLWRHVRGERFSGTRMINVPDNLYDAAVTRDRAKPFGAPMLDYGTFLAADRHANVERFKAAGKDDDYTRSVLIPPDLRVFPHQYDPTYGSWIDLMKASLHGSLVSPRS